MFPIFLWDNISLIIILYYLKPQRESSEGSVYATLAIFAAAGQNQYGSRRGEVLPQRTFADIK